MTTRPYRAVKLIDARSTVGFSGAVFTNADDYSTITLSVQGNAFVGTLSVVGTLDDNVDFSLPSSSTNSYVKLNTINLTDGNGTDGAITVTALTQSQLHEVNVSHIKSIAVIVDAATAGDISVKVSANAQGSSSNKLTKISLSPTSASPGVVTSYIDPANNKVVEHFKIINSTGVLVYEEFKYADGTVYAGAISALTPTVQSEIELQLYKDPLTQKPVLATTKYNPNGSISVGYPTYKFLDGTILPGQPASIATLVFPQDAQYDVKTSYWVDSLPVANTIKIKYTVLKDGVIQPLSGFVTLIDGTTTTLSVNAVPYDNDKATITFQNVTRTSGAGAPEQILMKESTDKVTGIVTRSFFTTNGAVAATPTTWVYGDLKFRCDATEAYDTILNVNVKRERFYNSLTNTLLTEQWVGTDGTIVAAPTSWTLGYRDLNSDDLLVQATAIKNALLTEDFAQEATLSSLNDKIIPTAKGIKTKSVITDGTDDVTVRSLAASTALNVSIVDALGAQITSFGVQPGSNDIFNTEAVTTGVAFSGVTTVSNFTNCIVIDLNNSITVSTIELQVNTNGAVNPIWRSVQLNNRTLGTVVTGMSTAGIYTANFGAVTSFRFKSTGVVTAPALTTIAWRATVGNIPDVVSAVGVAPNTASLSVQASITTGGVAQTILPLTAGRKGFEIQNNSSLDLRVAFGSTASATNGFIIKANEGSYSSGAFCSTSAISVFGTTTAQEFTYIELT